jgi:hypothetical protein
MRWRWPPLKACGKTVHKLGSEPDQPQQLGNTLHALPAA